jgi:protease-4
MRLKFWGESEPLPGPGDEGWEKALVNRVVLDHLREQRRSRRWGILFKFLTLGYLIAVLVALWPGNLTETVTSGGKHTALIEVQGIIAPETNAAADRVVAALRKAYEDDNTKGIVLRINSPGGSPVQAGYINDEIKRLREKHPDIPVYAVAADLCASGGYYVAVAADEIYVDKASLVGSIGVRIGTFGFVQAQKDLGIERRLLTAGQNKGILDPFSPLPDDQKVFLQGVLDRLHRQFIGVVKESRGERLKGGNELFSGLFWSGEESVSLGLADGVGNAGYVARELIGAEKIVEFSAKKDLLERFADRLGASLAESLLQTIGVNAYPLTR